MGVSRSSINSAARALKQPAGDTSPLWTPRQPQWSLHQNTIVGVDTGNNVAHVALNGSDEVAYGVRYGSFYGPGNPPQEGDQVWGLHNGKIMLLFARQDVPNGPVVLP